MNTVSNVKTILNLTSDAETVLTILNKIVEDEFKTYCNVDEIPDAAESVLTLMLMTQWNKRFTQGVQIQNYSDISEHYFDGYSSDILNQLKKFKRIKVIY